MIKTITSELKNDDKQASGTIAGPKAQTINFLLTFASVYPTKAENNGKIYGHIFN